METIKPETRCECPDAAHGTIVPHGKRCKREATLTVLMRTTPNVVWPAGQEYTLAMCEPCAQFHKAKAGA
jgi:hypothetical protein